MFRKKAEIKINFGFLWQGKTSTKKFNVGLDDSKKKRSICNADKESTASGNFLRCLRLKIFSSAHLIGITRKSLLGNRITFFDGNFKVFRKNFTKL